MKSYMVLLLAALASFVTAADKRMNVVVFLVDDLGYMDIGANNHKTFYETPHIDNFAKSGMRFTNGYAANPVCSPTRYSMMTGKYPTRVMATNFFSGKRSGKFNPAPLADAMPLSEITIAQALKKNGYKTFFAGKWHLGPSEEFYPDHRGFDINIGGHTAGGPYSGKKYFSPYDNPKMENGPENEHLPQRLANEAAKFIETNKDQPFFTYVSFYSVHTPLIGRPDLVEKYKAKATAINGDEFGQVAGDGHKVRILQNHAVYAAMVEAMDLAVGTVLSKLKELNLEDNTLVIFTSDNGGLSTTEGTPTSNLPLKGGKGWIYEGGIREPWIIRAPGLTKPGAVSDEAICSIDTYPTILSITGAQKETEQIIDGIDISTALRGEKLQREALYWHYPHYSNQAGPPGGAIRIGDLKLVEKYEDGSVELYNLKDDIGELKDLASTMPDKVKDMRAKLHAWYKTVDAKFLQKKGNGPEPWQPE